MGIHGCRSKMRQRDKAEDVGPRDAHSCVSVPMASAMSFSIAGGVEMLMFLHGGTTGSCGRDIERQEEREEGALMRCSTLRDREGRLVFVGGGGVGGGIMVMITLGFGLGLL